jgi:hypothetical protein
MTNYLQPAPRGGQTESILDHSVTWPCPANQEIGWISFWNREVARMIKDLERKPTCLRLPKKPVQGRFWKIAPYKGTAASHVSFSGTLTLRPPTNRPRDISTHTIRPPNILSTVTIFYCDTSTMWHFSTLTFRLCDNFLLRHFDHVIICYCDIPTLWQFSIVTLRPCDNFLLWHSVSKWTDCPSTPKSGRFVTLWHSDPL